MKKLILSAFLLLGGISAQAQVFSGITEIDKANKEGIYTSTIVDDKYVKDSWQKELSKYGKVESGRGGSYKVMNASVASISPDPVILYSKVSREKGRTQIFLSVNTGNETYITGTHAKYPAAEKILNDFIEVINLEEGVRTEQKSLTDISDKQSKVVKQGERLVRDIENNKKDKERLLKKIEDNRLELEKLLTDVEQNKRDQQKALEDVTAQSKKVEEAKNKVPKP
ncbi:hypothetical protein SAMN04515674_11664 [Pseudarcicella hirudinis]|uniref:DUF4468 domain-containing protein n=1 Tax=Pseudarcicella hirudinis TaxID=1079859 RepID=A0A1I5XZQ5_9BACT|nr:hypothetical protein [Pseudarcicella hirudinis]SFQ37340.1 hypothetical protein SAMN04515674_11664 [Pseudarcicella hirudinis]